MSFASPKHRLPLITMPVVAVAAMCVVATGAFVGGVTWSMEHASYDVWGGMLVVLGLAAVCAPLLTAAARREADPRVARALPWVFALKLAAGIGFLLVAQNLYDGGADANFYHVEAVKLVPEFRYGDFSHVGDVVGTGFIPAVTACFYVVVGVTKLGAFFIFSCLGFWGLYLLYRAFVRGVPDGDCWRYFLLVFLLPSLIFWSSSIGKDAWMLFGLGLAANGASRLVTGERWGFALTTLGLAATAMVRPHVTALVVVSLLVAYTLRRGRVRASMLGPVWKVGGVLVLLVAAYLVVRQAQHFLNLKEVSPASIDKALKTTQAHTATYSGSQVRAPGVHSLRDLPAGLIYVLFRPFPWQVHNGQALVTSLEGTALLGLFVVGWRRLRRAAAVLRAQPYVTFALVYTLLFVVAFSSVGNFGLIARERIQVYPMALVLLALPALSPTWRNDDRSRL